MLDILDGFVNVLGDAVRDGEGLDQVVERAKEAQKASLAKVDELFAFLQQRAFREEL